MNDFASALLSFLLSFTRSVANSALSIFQGTSGTFWAWIGAHWLPLTCVFVLAGLTIDIMVYILRWRPQYVWRSWLHRIFRTKDERMAEQQFDAGYDQGVQSFSFMDEPIPDIMETAPDEQLSRAITRYDVQAPAQPADTAVVRRRRSERHGRHLPVFRRLRTERNEDSRPVPVAHTREAFHDAVYPSLQPQDADQSQNGRNPYE